jgi:DNA repair exonuclease SbcCD ATPase subunit
MIPSTGVTGRTDTSWAKVALSRLRERNKVQTDPFVDIFQSHTNLWYENARMKSLLSDIKHQLAIVQHETVDAIIASASEGSNPMLENLKLKLSQVQSDLREKGTLDESEKKKRIDLSKKVRDQEKLIGDQREEIVIAKTELASALSRISELEEDIRIEKGSSKAVAAELESVRELYRKEQAENQQLLERILLEKMKTAEAMNDMMSGKKGGKCCTKTPLRTSHRPFHFV